jgi:hypothetical protein
MKRIILGFVLGSFITLSTPLAQTPAPSGAFSVNPNDPFARLIQSDSMIRERFEECQRVITELAQMDKCLWEEIQGIIGPPVDGYHERVTQGLRAITSRTVDENKKVQVETTSDFRLSSASIQNITPNQDQAVRKLQEHLENRLRLALYGDLKRDIAQELERSGVGSDKEIYINVDQQTFYELYENQVSKNIIATISNFCLQAKVDLNTRQITKYEKDEDGNSIMEANLAKLGNASVEHDNNPNPTGIAAADDWNICIADIPRACEQGTGQLKTAACTLTRSLRSARQALLEVGLIQRQLSHHVTGHEKATNQSFTLDELIREQQKAINDGKQNVAAQGNVIFAQRSLSKDDNIRVGTYRSTDANTSIDRITTLSSGEIHSSKNKYVSENVALLARFTEKCFNHDTKSLVGTLDDCKEFIDTDLEEQQERLAEVSLRSRAIAQRLQTEVTDEAQITSFLKDEGYTEDQIARMIDGAGDIEQLKDKINAQYDREREALIESITKQLHNRTLTDADFQDPSSNGSGVQKLTAIHNELSSRVERFTQLTHYNNIVSGFLAISGGGANPGETRFNTAVIQREMQNSFYGPNNTGRTPAESGLGATGYFENLTQAVEPHTGGSSASSGDGSTRITIHQLNESFLSYSKMAPAQQ